MKYNTSLIHTGEAPNLKDGGSGDVVVPLHLASTFARKEIEEPTNGYEYSRSGNPTRTALEQKLAALEGATYGLAFASGLAAETVLFLSLLQKGDHIVASDDLYGGTRRLLNTTFEKFGVTASYVDTTNADNVSTAILSNTKLVFLETPTNPLLKISDIRAIAAIAKKNNLITVVDNTFASPYFQQPLSLGADVVLHSTTKYINGHSDSIGGSIMTSDEAIFKKLQFNQNAIGAMLSPFDSYLVLRGIKTLALRMDRHNENAIKIAEHLSKHSKVSKVYYPGLPTHPSHEIVKGQMTGFGGIISFDLNGTLADTKKFLSSLNIFLLAESLGGVESLIEHPALMTHASVPLEDRLKIGITDSLIRVSVGIEDVEDLIADLNQAFEKISS